MSPNNNALAHNPNDAEKNAQDKKRKIIVFSMFTLIVAAACIYYYARTMVSSSEQLNQKPPVTSKVTPASKSKNNGRGDDFINDSSPAKLVIQKHEDVQKAQAKANGQSFIDSTQALAEKANAHKKPAPATKKEVEKKEPAKKKEDKKAVTSKGTEKTKTDDQIRRENMAKLLTLNGAYPTSEKAAASARKSIQKLHADTKNIKHQEYTTIVPLVTQPIESEPKKATKETASGSKTKKEKEPTVTAYVSGDMVMCSLKFQVKSDYKLPVFCDVVEPPLKAARIIGSFSMTERQDGVILKGNRMEIDGKPIKMSAYAVNITTDLSPLFDNNYESHFMKKFLARASAAFMLPFVDFVTGSSSTVSNGTVIVDNTTVESTTDRIVGGLGSVAKEFIPDLRANANIPPTITIPESYVVGMVFMQSLNVPESLLKNKNSNEPARPTTTFGRN